MALPIQASLSGGSSSAESGVKSGDLGASGGGGSRAPVFNVATGGSRLAATTGTEGGALPQWIWYAVAAAALWIWYKKGGRI